MQTIRIPEERVSVLIGTKGSTKAKIEERTHCKLSISDGEVSVEGEAMDEWVAKDVVHAIGRGFNPEKALFLTQEGNVFEMIDLSDHVSTQKSQIRLRGRIIGENGKTRRFLERNTGAMMSVFGKTVSLIGPFDSVSIAREAIQMLITGARHATVYRFLEKNAIRA